MSGPCKRPSSSAGWPYTWCSDGVPGPTRTGDLPVRNRPLCPAELQGHGWRPTSTPRSAGRPPWRSTGRGCGEPSGGSGSSPRCVRDRCRSRGTALRGKCHAGGEKCLCTPSWTRTSHLPVRSRPLCPAELPGHLLLAELAELLDGEPDVLVGRVGGERLHEPRLPPVPRVRWIPGVHSVTPRGIDPRPPG